MKKIKNKNQNIVQFFLELGILKRMPRSGWLLVGIQNPETVADHSFRTAMIAWALAKFENADTDKVVKMGLLHDLEEARTGDLNNITKRYHPNDRRKKAYSDILKNSPFGAEALMLVDELNNKRTIEAKIVKDADKLDLFLQALEYENAGFKESKKWKVNAKSELKLKSSKILAKVLEKRELNWWYPWRS